MPYKVRLSCCILPRTPRERRSKAKRLRQSRKKLNEEFGANPKQWLTEKMKSRILHLAKVRDTTPTEIANKVHMSQIKFFKFCRKYFDCTATELIARVQGEE